MIKRNIHKMFQNNEHNMTFIHKAKSPMSQKKFKSTESIFFHEKLQVTGDDDSLIKILEYLYA